MRSPIVIRNVLSAMVGRRSRRSAASRASMPAVSNGRRATSTWVAVRVMRGGFPSNTDSGMSIGWSAEMGVVDDQLAVVGGVPTTAYGQRSRAHSAAKASRRSGAMAST